MATPLPVFLAQLQASKVLINPLTSRTMVKHGDKTVLDAQKFVPKRTRSLMRSIKRGTPRPGFGGITLLISAGGPSSPNDVDYAGHVEEGTGNMAPQPFMRPAINKNEPLLEKDLANLMELLAAGRPGRASSRG